MASEGGNKAIIAALSANLGIAVTKFAAFLLTGMSSMLAEAIHSTADTCNQFLLLIGGKQARKDATDIHPFGFGRGRYLAAFVVAILLFSLGGLFSLFEAYEKFKEATGPHPKHPSASDKWWWVPIVVIVVSIVMEGSSFRTAFKASSKARGERSIFAYIRGAKDPEIPVVLLEDSAAVTGLLFALFGITMSVFTENGIWDAVGAGLIGLLLVGVAIILGRETQSLLLGESATPKVVATIRDAISSTAGLTLIHLKTSHLGPQELLVAAKVGIDPKASGRDIADSINAAEAAMRAALPQLEILSYIEPDIDTGAAPAGSIGHLTISHANEVAEERADAGKADEGSGPRHTRR